MISDEPDEDADALDDDAAIESYLGGTSSGDAPVTPGRGPAFIEVKDWPPRSGRDLGLTLDTDTLAWFRETYPDWRHQMRTVLRAWMIDNMAEPAGSRLTAVDDETS